MKKRLQILISRLSILALLDYGYDARGEERELKIYWVDQKDGAEWLFAEEEGAVDIFALEEKVYYRDPYLKPMAPLGVEKFVETKREKKPLVKKAWVFEMPKKKVKKQRKKPKFKRLEKSPKTGKRRPRVGFDGRFLEAYGQ